MSLFYDIGKKRQRGLDLGYLFDMASIGLDSMLVQCAVKMAVGSRPSS
jgi:hypothetical protein